MRAAKSTNAYKDDTRGRVLSRKSDVGPADSLTWRSELVAKLRRLARCGRRGGVEALELEDVRGRDRLDALEEGLDRATTEELAGSRLPVGLVVDGAHVTYIVSAFQESRRTESVVDIARAVRGRRPGRVDAVVIVHEHWASEKAIRRAYAPRTLGVRSTRWP